jgi:hypothetical protein
MVHMEVSDFYNCDYQRILNLYECATFIISNINCNVNDKYFSYDIHISGAFSGSMAEWLVLWTSNLMIASHMGSNPDRGKSFP